MDEWEVYPREAAAVGAKAVQQGVARLKLTRDEIYKIASEKIKRARAQAKVLMDSGIIKMP
jgi:malate dehydrogenase (oxaloacetate-decarboxylating)